MNKDTDASLSKAKKYTAWVLLFAVILLHTLPYLDRYTLPHYDYGNVMHAINYLQSPKLFNGDRISKLVVNFYTRTAPLYFYGLSLPLSYVFNAKWTLLAIGIPVSFGSAYFAGGSWTRKKNLLVAILTLLLLIHCYINPLEGNRRSFTGLFLLGGLWLGKNPNFLAQAILIGLAAGIYPPVALLTMIYFGILELDRVRKNPSVAARAISKFFGLLIIFFLVLTPYWWNLLSTETHSEISQLALSPGYQFHSLNQLINSFLVGDYGALFREPLQFNLFLVFLSLLALQLTILRKKFTIQPIYIYLFVASVGLWLIAHLVHPLIYHPFKYTRLSLILVLALPFFENLPATADVLWEAFAKHAVLRYLFLFSSLLVSVIWLGYVLSPELFKFLQEIPFLKRTWWKFAFSLPVFLTLMVVFPSLGKANYTRALIAGLMLSLMIYPHDFATYQSDGIKLSDLDGMYRFLRSTPPGTMVAGPPIFYMDFVPAFGKRGVYGSGNLASWNFYCKRMKNFWQAYFSGKTKPLLNFLKTNEIDYLLIDKKMLKNRNPYGVTRCQLTLENSRPPVLNQPFQKKAWFFEDRLSLIARHSLAASLEPGP